MSDPTQPELTLAHVAQFHQQIICLQKAGIRLQLGAHSSTSENLPEALNQIMSELVSQASKHKSLDVCVQEAAFLPARYRIALQTWAKCDCSVESLSILRAPIQQDNESSLDLRFALVLPLIIFTLVYGASFYLLLVTLPKMEGIYSQLNETPSTPVRWLANIRWAMPYWAPGLPILLLIVGWLIFTGQFKVPRWLPGHWRSFKYSSASQYAQNLAMQLERSDAKDATSTEIANNATSPQEFKQAPMLNWALTSGGSKGNQTDEKSTSVEQRTRRLRLAAKLYETMQANHAQQFRSWLVLGSCVCLGGGVTLVYALALFAPLVQLLKDIVG